MFRIVLGRAISWSSNVGMNKAIPVQGLLTRNFGISPTFYQTSEEINEKQKIDPSKDRTKIIPVETSIKYLKSDAYKETYGDQPIWVKYRRNHKGSIPPRKTRRTCIRQGIISTGNPCPICRDEYLVLEHTNIELLKQFISPYTGEVLGYTKTGLCQKRHVELLVAIKRAKDYGLITFDVPFRMYDYSEWY